MKKTSRTRLLIWFAMVSALLVYVLLAYTAAVQTTSKEIVGALVTLRNVLFAYGSICLIAGFVAPNFIERRMKRRTPELAPTTVNVIFVIRLALFEGAALSGMFFTFITSHLEYTFYSTLAAFIGMLIYFPKEELRISEYEISNQQKH